MSNYQKKKKKKKNSIKNVLQALFIIYYLFEVSQDLNYQN